MKPRFVPQRRQTSQHADGRRDHAGPSDAQVQVPPVVGLVRQRVAAEGGHPAEAPATEGAGEAADGHGEAVDEGELPGDCQEFRVGPR